MKNNDPSVLKIEGIKLTVSRYMRAEGYVIPRWFGVAYNDWINDVQICYPIPINLLVRFKRWLHYTVLRPFKVPRWLAWEERIFNKGYEAGKLDSQWTAHEKLYDEEQDRVKKKGMDWDSILNGEDEE